MNDLLVRAKDALAKGGIDAHLKRLDSFTGREGVILRPSAPTVIESYMDGTRAVDYVYQVVARYRSAERAMTVCSDALDVLDGAWLESANGSYRFEGQEVYTHPQELALDEAGYYAWETRLVAHITEE